MDDITVVLADDHEIWRNGVRADLGDGFEVVGEAGTAEDAIAVIRTTRPGLVVCDLHMPGGGIQVVKACADETKVVMLTVSEAAGVRFAIEFDARSYEKLAECYPAVLRRLRDAVNEGKFEIVGG